MKTYNYELTAKLNATEDVYVFEEGKHVYTVNRVYDNGLKKLLDGYFDYRYFLKYTVKNTAGEPVFMCKKIQRKGRLWFEATDLSTNEKYIINYENWRIGVPELFIKGEGLDMKIDKEMEDWSNFLIGETIVARWLPIYNEEAQTFTITLELLQESLKLDASFFLAIAQATLFIGA